MNLRITAPERRLLQAYAYDPMRADLDATEVTLRVPFEALRPGPVGALVKVIDYDPLRDCWYAPVDLEDPLLLAQDGLAPSEADPRFHQQMVYAVAASVLERFERALGRRFRFGSKPLVMFPHAFCDQNAYYDPDREAVLFGYFRADPDRPGAMLPRQVAFTCLSHDIIAHELTHAVVDKLRPALTDSTNHDVAAFHEAFADLVALFHHFTLPDLVRRHLQSSRGDVSSAAPLVELARQFGEAAGMGGALRSGLDTPDPTRLARTLECHDRGSILVAAVFAAFIQAYEARVADLVRIATGGTGQLPPGHLHPDLVSRVADEAIANAERFLTICVRAFDYLPVVDVTFGDFLRALVTADRALFPTDRARRRAMLIESFRVRGIYPESVVSLAEDSLVWPDAHIRGELPGVAQMVRWTAEDFDLTTRGTDLPERLARQIETQRATERKALAHELHAFITAHPSQYGFHADVATFKIAVRGFHASFRPSEDGQPRVDLVIQATQNRPDLADRPELKDTGIRVWAGTTIVADSLGRIRHVITKPLPANANQPFAGPGGERFARICEFVSDRDALDVARAWTSQPDRIIRALSFARLHQERIGTCE